MRCLLDGHSNINVFPTEVTKFLELFAEESGYSMEVSPDLTTKRLLSQFKTDVFSDNFSSFDFEMFKSQLKPLSKKPLLNPVDFIEGLFRQTFHTQRRLNVCDVTSPNISGYLKQFPDAKIIHMIRNPLSILDSGYRFRFANPNSFRSHPGQWEMAKWYDAVYDSFKQASRHNNHPNVCVVKLESLQQDTERELIKVFKFIDENVQPINSELTILNERNLGNSTRFKSSEVVVQEPDFSCLTPNDLFYASRTPHADQFYKLEQYPYKSNSFFRFFARHMGWTGKNRTRFVRSPIRLFIKLPVYTVSNWLQDMYIKHLLKIRLNDENENASNKL